MTSFCQGSPAAWPNFSRTEVIDLQSEESTQPDHDVAADAAVLVYASSSSTQRPRWSAPMRRVHAILLMVLAAAQLLLMFNPSARSRHYWQNPAILNLWDKLNFYNELALVTSCTLLIL